MKEKLITFTRNEENIKKVGRANFIISLLIIIMYLFTVGTSIVEAILFSALTINFMVEYFIKGLYEENEDVIRNNYLLALF